jgi:hypothetical protein
MKNPEMLVRVSGPVHGSIVEIFLANRTVV